MNIFPPNVKWNKSLAFQNKIVTHRKGGGEGGGGGGGKGGGEGRRGGGVVSGVSGSAFPLFVVLPSH